MKKKIEPKAWAPTGFAYLQGQSAFWAGGRGNPYILFSKHHARWEEGFEKARKQWEASVVWKYR